MPIVPKDTNVVAIPFVWEKAGWELPTLTAWDAPESWANLINWNPEEFGYKGSKVWWTFFERCTKEDYQFDFDEGIPWHTDANRDGPPDFTFVRLYNDKKYAGFLVANEDVEFTEQEEAMPRGGIWGPYMDRAAENITPARWRAKWQVSIAQYNDYCALVGQRKHIEAIRDYRRDHHLCMLRRAKDAIDALKAMMIRDGILKP